MEVRGQAGAAADTAARSTSSSAWECTAVPWFDDPDCARPPLTADGPASWSTRPEQSTRVRRAEAGRCPTVEVSNIRTTDDSIEFDVSRTGVPVMVKTSYFPNWKAEGADGPWRATPNFMVVVPTEQARDAHVRHDRDASSGWAASRDACVGLVGPRRPGAGGAGGPHAPDDGDRRAVRTSTRRPAGYAFPSRSRRGEDPRLPWPTLRSTPSSRPTTSAGSIPTSSTKSIARRVGNAFVAFTGAARVLVGRDARPSSEPLVAAFIEGATLAGRRRRRPRARVHRPLLLRRRAASTPRPRCSPPATTRPQYNGIKLCRAGAAPDRARTPGSPRSRRWSPPGSSSGPRTPAGSSARRPAAGVRRARALVRRRRRARAAPGRRRHRQRRRRAHRARGVRAACRSSSRCSTASSTARSRTIRPTRPTPRTSKDLQRAVLDADADVGLAFDGDADRVVLVDDQAQPVSGSTTTAILAAAILGRHPGETGRAQPDLLEGRPRGDPRARRHAGPHPRRPLVHQAGDGRDRTRSSAASTPRTTTSATTSAPTPASSPRCIVLEQLSTAGRAALRAARAVRALRDVGRDQHAGRRPARR